MELDSFCADASREAGEPLLGTAAEAPLWLLVEHDGPWGPKGLPDSQLAEAALAELEAFAKDVKDVRVQLARRPDRTGDEVRIWFASTRPGAQELWQLTLNHIDALGSVDLKGFVAGRPPEGAVLCDAPMFFVCVHGKRDRCCAMRGMPVYSELNRLTGQRTWMTTHLGGHRFAPTLIVLPHGICYGRVEPSEMEALVTAHARGEIFSLERMRGRTSYPEAVQAAEVFLRTRLAERKLDALELMGTEPGAEGTRVLFRERANGAEHEVRVASEALLPIMQSCGAAPKPAKRFVTR